MPDPPTLSQGSPPKDLLVPGHTCWRRAPAARAAFLVDAASYFAALADAIDRARHRVMLLGWDFHSRVALWRDGREPAADELAAVLDAAVRRRRGLQIFVLEWDFAMLYWPERESLRSYRFASRTHRRVRFAFDAEHPVGASHHQKIAVIDDALAFAGGIDVTSNRWDTREHRAREPRRVDPDGRGYAPFHDAQMAVDGAAAAALGELARERWRAATGRRLRPVSATADPWPASLEPQLRDVEIGIARTQPGDTGCPAVREVETLYHEAIAAARHSIYIENQYLTAAGVADALAKRLAEADGPEVVIVAPSACSGWLEEKTMGVLRDRFVEMLRDADRHDRLRILYPVVPGLAEGEHVNVHAKLMVVDDRLARVGSANLSNRSMGFDTECDLAVEASTPEHAAAIARFRDELLAEHLGTPVERVAEVRTSEKSLVRCVDRLRGGERSLEPVVLTSDTWSQELVQRFRVFDPEAPLQMEELLPRLGFASPESQGDPSRRRAVVGIVLCALLAAAWRFTPLAEVVEPQTLAALSGTIRAHPFGAPLASLGFALATLAFVPVTALIVACGLVFPPLVAFGVALGGTCLGALVGYALGRGLWRDALRRLAGSRLQRLSRSFARRGALVTATVRLVPIAPFALVNLVAGASRVRWQDYALGTLLAMLPGIAGLIAVADRVARAMARPDAGSVLAACAAAALLALAIFGLGRLAGRLRGVDGGA